MDYDLFTNEKEKQAAITSLHGFIDSPGWKLIEKALDLNAKYFEEQLRANLRDGRFESLEQANSLQKRIDDILSLKDLPNKLLQAAQPEPEEEEEEDLY